MTGEGYYRNAHDFVSVQTLLLQPSGPMGTGRVVLCAYDPLTGADNRSVVVDAPNDAVLVVDGVFGMRPEYDEYWDVRIWLHAEPAVALRGESSATSSWRGTTMHSASIRCATPSAKSSTSTR